jgi:hypothetical protein
MSSDDRVEPPSAAPVSPSERRRNLRFPFMATVEAVEMKTGAKVLGRTSDLSLGGCYVDTASPFSAGTDAKIRITRGIETFEAQAKVIYSSIGMGMGLAFVSAQQKQVRLFQRWLLEVSAQSAPSEQASFQDASTQDASETAPIEKPQELKNDVLSDLIMMLVQKKVLTQVEGKDLLKKLFR